MKIHFNADPTDIFAIEKKKILFVHVGKCAGGSIMHVLEGRLSDDFVLYEMHVYDANKRIRAVVESDPGDIIYLVAKRDPVSRFVSAFNWDKHNLFLKGTLKNTKWEKYYMRFPTVDSLLSGLLCDDRSDQTIAEEFSRFGHMGMGQEWYTPQNVLERLPEDRTYFVDTASLRHDLLAILNALGQRMIDLDWQPPALKSNFGDAYVDHAHLFPTHLSQASRAALLRHIAGDISIYTQMSNRKIGRAHV